MKRASRLVLLLVLALVVILMAVPNTALAFLRSEYAWLGRLGSWVDHLWPGVDAGHLLAFGALGVLGALAWPRMGFGRVLFVLAVLAAGTELLQVWVPGRTARAGDVVADVAGGLIGWLVVRGVQLGFAARNPAYGARSRPPGPPPPRE